MSPLKILLIDNYDSYTFNLYQLLAESNGGKLSDAAPYFNSSFVIQLLYLPAQAHQRMKPTLALGFVHGASVVHAPEPVHGRVFEVSHTGHELLKDVPSGKGNGFETCSTRSPGAPGSSEHGSVKNVDLYALGNLGESRNRDVDLYRNVSKHPPDEGFISFLGQQLALHKCRANGEGVAQADAQRAELAGRWQVVRYHSLVVDEATLPADLQAIAWTVPQGSEAPVLMGLAHASRPHFDRQRALALNEKVWWRKLEGVRAKSEALFWAWVVTRALRLNTEGVSGVSRDARICRNPTVELGGECRVMWVIEDAVPWASGWEADSEAATDTFWLDSAITAE
eukprot:gene12857-15193_t